MKGLAFEGGITGGPVDGVITHHAIVGTAAMHLGTGTVHRAVTGAFAKGQLLDKLHGGEQARFRLENRRAEAARHHRPLVAVPSAHLDRETPTDVLRKPSQPSRGLRRQQQQHSRRRQRIGVKRNTMSNQGIGQPLPLQGEFRIRDASGDVATPAQFDEMQESGSCAARLARHERFVVMQWEPGTVSKRLDAHQRRRAMAEAIALLRRPAV